MSNKVVLLSMNSLENFYTYDKLLIEPMKNIGWDAEEVSWRSEKVNWNYYNAVIVRSTWDYQKDHKKFIEVLEKIKYQLLGPYESDISRNKISVTSPIGKALIGKNVGSEINVKTPGGTRNLEITDISVEEE